MMRNKLWAILIPVLVVFAIVFLAFKAGYFRDVKKEDEKIVFNPEIPINEYWDWGKINNLHLYINNTDKNVIYALDDSGKIIWTIWGKDYGIDGFEIFRKQNKLLIKDTVYDALKTNWSILWVFDGDGKLRWKHTFKGYLDLPQALVTLRNNLILRNGSNSRCNAGCGVICKEELKNSCPETHTWAFTIDTGSIVWRNNTPNYHGHYLQLDENGKIIARSSGVGWGRLNHEYILHSDTGVIEKQRVSIDDREYNQDPENALTLDVNTKRIILHKRWTDEERWSLGEKSYLYQWAKENLDGRYKTAILDELIVSSGENENGKTKVFAFDKNRGQMLWQKQYYTADFSVLPSKITKDGILLLNLRYTSRCESICEQYSESEGVYYDKSKTVECKECWVKDKARSDYAEFGIWAVNAKTGGILWKKSNFWFSKIDENNLITANLYMDNKTAEVVKLKLKTGEEVR